MPDLSSLPPEAGLMARYLMGLRPPSREQGAVAGFGASAGVVTGRARVIKDLGESDRLEQGDVLVCVSTAPPWTPLFAVAAAVVTDTGGVMSHSAICAREFAIPCVVGTQIGTRRIPDGATVRVDGTTGRVELVAEPG
jgi:pyruvate,water dikinase